MMNAPETSDEHDVIRKCLSGNSEQYSLLVDRYKDMAYNVAYRLLGDGDAAKDVAQESFISAYTALGEFRQGSKFSSWLYRIVVNRCKDLLKVRRETVAVDDICDVVAARERTPEQAVSTHETCDAIQKALARLPLDYREVIVLKHMEELGYDEIGGILGVSVPALKVRAHRGREMLRQVLESMGVGV
jgi:RNA polymerase sigma-70 factor (ECF subfamily)